MDENIYGHGKRLEWIRSHVNASDRVLEFGSGTGVMITLPLLLEGFDAFGVDLDAPSIEYGRQVLVASGHDPERLSSRDLDTWDVAPDVIVASEVLEHVPDAEMESVLGTLRRALPDDGKLLVTVPNGYGWFELESFLWFKAGVGRALELLRMVDVVQRVKRRVCGPQEDELPSTLSSSPHVQRFTRASIRRLLDEHGFDVGSVRGTVLFAGPFSNLFFTGCACAMSANRRLGDLFPACASGFLVDAVKREGEQR